MWLFDDLGIDVGYVILGIAGIMFIMIILLIVTMVKNSGLRKKYEMFMDGEDGKNLEKAILDKFAAIDTLEGNVNEIYGNIKAINNQLITAYQKVGLVKYDAFREIGGKLSFVLVLLTADNNGFILNSMHSKEGCYTYTKEVVNGEVFIVLSEEERQALEEAKTNSSLKKLAESNQ
ncbi:DUF4446 family protein [bacterium D16-51]|nr:DUF4446 family protein [bacterium D16-59]RKI60390.1 DUF4446 family protein [bacterium D16-51]